MVGIAGYKCIICKKRPKLNGHIPTCLLYTSGSVYVVQGDREVLIPDRPEFVRSIDPAAGRMVVHLIEGM